MKFRKVVSISEELYLAIRMLDGMRELAERLGESTFDGGPTPLAIASMVVLLRERLRMLDRAVRSTVDPLLLWCRENDATEPIDADADADSGDVLLRSWSDKKTIKRLRSELKSAKRRLRSVRST